MKPVNVTKANFESEVLNYNGTVLVDFWASWCGPCRMLSPIVDQIAEENPEIKVAKVNVDDDGELAAQFSVMSIPTLIVFRNGKAVSQSLGVRPKAQILEMLK